MATLITTTSEAREVKPAKGKKFKLEELQGFVGGYIELVRLSKRQNMIVNEEGRLKGLAVNEVASALANRLIVGDVVVCGPGEL